MNQPPTAPQPQLSYDERFWEQYLGPRLVSDPVIAIVELVANTWDAGARKVEIRWPVNQGDTLRIADDGEGMSDALAGWLEGDTKFGTDLKPILQVSS